MRFTKRGPVGLLTINFSFIPPRGLLPAVHARAAAREANAPHAVARNPAGLRHAATVTALPL